MALEPLTDRQRTVLQMLNAGTPIPSVAKTLGISPNGVYAHIRRIKDRGYKVNRTPKKARNGTKATQVVKVPAADLENVISPAGPKIQFDRGKLADDSSAANASIKDAISLYETAIHAGEERLDEITQQLESLREEAEEVQESVEKARRACEGLYNVLRDTEDED